LVCLGEALVDLICPDPVTGLTEARRFDAHFGGALANVAVASARAGAATELAGGCGNDEWGRFLRDRLREEGVGLRHYSVVDGLETPFAFATLDEAREPTFRIHGDGIDDAIATLTGDIESVVVGAGAIAFGSNTLPGPSAREVTLAVRDAAREAGVPLLFDPNLRRGRWEDLEAARRLCLELAADATLLKCNLGEARWLSGLDGADGATVAETLVELGPRLVVVTGGGDPIAARGCATVDVTPPEVEMLSPLGAGDAFMGTLAAGLLGGGWEPTNVEAALGRAGEAGAEACTRLGAFD